MRFEFRDLDQDPRAKPDRTPRKEQEINIESFNGQIDGRVGHGDEAETNYQKHVNLC
jgi:hypothetical protein